jgi:putative membrane protein
MLAAHMALAPRSLTTPAVRAELAAAVSEAERDTSAELVVLVSARSGSYPEAGWMLGLASLLGVFAVLMFHEAEIGDYTLFLGPILAFAAGFALPILVPRLRAWLTPRATLARQVELVARASFQKAALHATRDATALLVFVSLLERAVVVLPDRGLVASMPEGWLAATRARLMAAVASREPVAPFLAAIRGLGPDLARHLPRRPDDMNELPNAIDVVF